MTAPLRILVVDDDRDNADSMVELFELEGHSATAAYSGEEAILAYQSVEFDVAFMDVMMPGRNGVESFLEIRRLRPNAKVYMMTGYSVEQLLQQAMDNGALGIFTKPVDPGKVLVQMEKLDRNGIVLVAEDDVNLGPQLRELIAHSGRSCELVCDGKEAVSRVAEGHVDVLILDLNLPLINGIDVLKTLRDRELAVPTIMITGCAEKFTDSFESLRDIEYTGILNKPFDPGELLSRIQRLAARPEQPEIASAVA